MSDNTMSRDIKSSINPTDYYISRIQDFKRSRPGWQNVKCVFHGDHGPSLAVNAETGGYLCFGCGAKGGDIIAFEMAMDRCSFNDAIKTLKNFAGLPDYRPRPRITTREAQAGLTQIQKLKKMWEGAGPLTADNGQADVARKYLVYRGLVKILDDLPNDLRTKCLEYWDTKAGEDKPSLRGTYNALLAVVRDAAGYPCMIHRTYLGDGGERKAYVNSPRKLTARIRDPKGAAIKLYAPTDELCLAEGIETALSVRVASGLPVWATVSTSLMTGVVIPDSVKRVWVMADNDENGAGELAANKLVARLLKEGRDARLVMPAEVDSDWNDVLMVGANHG